MSIQFYNPVEFFIPLKSRCKTSSGKAGVFLYFFNTGING